MVTYLLLALSITFEICATSMLNTTEGFTRPFRSAWAILLYYASYITFSRVIIYLNKEKKQKMLPESQSVKADEELIRILKEKFGDENIKYVG